MVRAPSRPWLWLAVVVTVVGQGGACATAEPPPAIVALPPPAPSSTPAPALRLAWLPLDGRTAPGLAADVNARLPRLQLEGVTETFQAPVSMETAQLAIECIEQTPLCWTKVGQSVGADRLLWAELRRGGHGGAVTLGVSLFDVASSALVRKAARPFPSTKAARAGVAALLDEAFGADPGAAP